MRFLRRFSVLRFSTHARLSLLGLTLMMLLGVSCQPRAPIKLGFAGQLTGRGSDIGIDGRDGAQLAVEWLNARGGISGRPLELVVVDDKGDPSSARQADARLIDAGVAAIVGHSSSNQTAAVLEQMNAAEVVLFSPTASSDAFAGQADSFFRVAPMAGDQGAAFAAQLHTQGIGELAIAYDLSNSAFTEAFMEALSHRFQHEGGRVSALFPFAAKESDLRTLSDRMRAANPQAILLVASGIDSALLAQYLRQGGYAGPLLASSWAQTTELLTNGGSAVEGLQLAAIYDGDNAAPPFRAFVTHFQERFGREPSYAALFAYDATIALAEGLRLTRGQRQGLAAALGELGWVPGLQGPITLDAFGDTHRHTYLVVVRDGRFQTVTIMPPPS